MEVSRLTDPPGPVQVSVNVCFEYMGGVFSEPESGLPPLHPPEALQESVFDETHLSEALCPDLTHDPGGEFSVNKRVGAGKFDCFTAGALETLTEALCAMVPLGPVHVRINVCVELE